jgi:hypothetical protein
VGGGIEWAFWNNWSMKAEYNYYDFGTSSVTLVAAVRSKNDLDVKEIVNLWAGGSAAVESMLARHWNDCARARDYLCLARRHAEPGWL